MNGIKAILLSAWVALVACPKMESDLGGKINTEDHGGGSSGKPDGDDPDKHPNGEKRPRDGERGKAGKGGDGGDSWFGTGGDGGDGTEREGRPGRGGKSIWGKEGKDGKSNEDKK